MYDFVYSLLGLVQKSVSPWHTAAAAAERLEKAGFARLDMRDLKYLLYNPWKPAP